MGLDMYSYAIDPSKANILEDCRVELKDDSGKEEIFYWRKHHDLHGWMENLYISKGGQEEFNCQPVRLTPEDLDNLEQDIITYKLPRTQGFFFGDNPPDEESVSNDLLFIAKAREALNEGKVVYYDSWW